MLKLGSPFIIKKNNFFMLYPNELKIILLKTIDFYYNKKHSKFNFSIKSLN
jgi:hypothetical protein